MQFVVGAFIGVGIYLIHKRQKKRNDVYPTWTGHMNNERGQQYPINWPDFKIIDGEKIRCTGADPTGEFQIKGKINKDGSVPFTYTNHKGKSTIQFCGYVTGANKISGTWAKGAERGHFEISMEARVYNIQTFTENTINRVQEYNYPIAFTKKSQYLIGVGRDSLGPYTIRGKLSFKKNTFFIMVRYNNGVVFNFDASKKRDVMSYDGTFVTVGNSLVQSGKCMITATQYLSNQKQQPHPTHQLGQPMAFNPENHALIPQTQPPIHNYYQHQSPQPVQFPQNQLFQEAKIPAQPAYHPYQPPVQNYFPNQPFQPTAWNGQPTRPVTGTPFD